MCKKKINQNLAPLIALVGCDGSGKTTLSGDIANILSQDYVTQRCYLGQGSGYIGRKIREFKLGGLFLNQFLNKKAKTARTPGKEIPGVLTALVIFIFSCVRFYHFQQMMNLRRKGTLIITDRYPQVDVAGFYDGPGLSAAHTKNWFISKLVKWEYRLYDRMTSVKPDVVIRLNIDAATAFARKPDHDYHLLESKVEATKKLTFKGAHIVDIDSTSPYEEVYKTALSAVKEVL